MGSMMGPEILVGTMSLATTRGNARRAWQYHSRSDTHSKTACWTLLFDLLAECDVLQAHARDGRLAFRINHVMVGPINKTLDLVVTIVPPGREIAGRSTFSQLVDRFGVQLSGAQRARLSSLPDLVEDRRDDVAEVAIALEAKACMTEHSKSLPRLHAEILATGFLARQASTRCITASYTLVNAAPMFISPGEAGKLNQHKQPEDARKVVEMIGKAIPLARNIAAVGYDVVGVNVIECRNDGSPVTLVSGPAAPKLNEHHHYERMVRSLCSEYRSRFR